MKVTLFACGPAANESELKAYEHLRSRLQSSEGEDEWLLLTNLAFSVTHQLQSDEIDIVAIGPPGIQVIEVKHWTAQWVDKNPGLVNQEADRLTNKARKIGSTLRKLVPDLTRVDGAILVTQEPTKIKSLVGRKVRGVSFFSLKEWSALLQLDGPTSLDPLQIRRLGKALEPKSAVAMDGSLRRIAGYVNLELQTPKEERFHRIYKGSHSARQDRVILHLYDLSAGDEKNAEILARREFDVLQRIQLYAWAPRILESYQEAPGFYGEMFFFTVVDPAAPSLGDRASDPSWETPARISFARSTIRALSELHGIGEEGVSFLHRNISPKTILVKHDNTPILSGFGLAKIPSEVSISNSLAPQGDWNPTVAPEVLERGLAVADKRSDIYSLSASLCVLFDQGENQENNAVTDALKKGMAEAPDDRLDLKQMESILSELLGESAPLASPPPARYWTEDQIVRFRDRDYRIVSRLGSGGVGMTFKVVEINRSTKEDVGTYVGKVAHNQETGSRVLSAYTLARPHAARHYNLSAIFEVSREYQENNFVSLMTWIEGSPLAEFMGLLQLLAEDQQGESTESLALRWLRSMCEALYVLHRNGLVHGDVSPRNMIVSGSDLVLTDYDFVCRIGELNHGPGTILYCSPSFESKTPVSPSDDLYALAASFFHVLFEKEPFLYDGVQAKERGLNWAGLDCDGYPILIHFLNRATNPDPEKRFHSVPEALEALDLSRWKEQATVVGGQLVAQVEDRVQSERGDTTEGASELCEQKIEWLFSLLQSYPGSRWGNRETRGLDTQFAARTYVETNLEEALFRDVCERRVRIVVLCGNAGDGKTALLQHLASKLGLGRHSSSERLLVGRMTDGLTVRMNLDGSAAWKGRSADELLYEFLEPFQEGPPDKDIVHLLAINDGRLLEWIDRSEKSPLVDDLFDYLQGDEKHNDSHIRFISMNQRSLVGGIEAGRKGIKTDFLNRLMDQLYGGDQANEIWSPCQVCTARERCEVHRALMVFGPEGVHGAENPQIRSRARQRLFEALQAVHLRGEKHITVRELRATLVYILFGVHPCEDYHKERDEAIIPYWDRAFLAESFGRQGEVLSELPRFDPALEAHPQIDRYLLSTPYSDSLKTAPRYAHLALESARRRAYFEWTEEHISQVAGDPSAIGLARGSHLKLFRSLPLENEEMDSLHRAEICARLCEGIARLEDLPPQALDRQNVVPLRITPRTPTETAFWVEKPVADFRIEVDLPPEREGLDRLHRQAFLIYRYRNGREERLPMGAELFHLFLELAEGFQLGDISSEDTFAQLSIFVQRLVREDERELMAWNPIEEENIFRVSAEIENISQGPFQRLVLSKLLAQEVRDE